MTLHKRHIAIYLKEAAQDTPAIILQGPRQCGKSTASTMVDSAYQYFTFDDVTTLKSAQSDPKGFVLSLPQYCILDEIQRVPELFTSLKLVIDQKRTPGRFILTGSSDILSLPLLSDSLAGRIEVVTMSPLTQAEIEAVPPTIESILNGDKISAGATSPDDILARVCRGGFPEVQNRSSKRRASWFKSYLNTLIQRDIMDISHISAFDQIPQLTRLLANRIGNLLNVADISKSLKITQPTVDSYIGLLRQIFVVHMSEPYFNNLEKRIVKSPKVHLVDTGMAASLLNVDENTIQQSPHRGKLVESFVVNEIRSQLLAQNEDVRFLHYRDRDKYEVDLVIEFPDESIVGIEVKSAHSVFNADFNGLRKLQRVSGDRFQQGILFYFGDTTYPFGDNFRAVPISSLYAEQ